MPWTLRIWRKAGEAEILELDGDLVNHAYLRVESKSRTDVPEADSVIQRR